VHCALGLELDRVRVGENVRFRWNVFFSKCSRPILPARASKKKYFELIIF